MAITVKHNKVSTIPDDADTSLVRPSDWNADHTLTGTVPVDNGGTGASTLTGYVKGNGTAAMTATTTVPSTDITGLGTMSTQNSNNISVTGGSISGTTVSGYIPTTEKAVANGVATLDGSGTVPISQLPAAVLGALSYQGTWNASTNTPTLTSSVGTKGYYYVVNVAGSTNLNGVTDWQVGDWAVYNGSAWQKVDNTDAVTSVNGYTGTVVLGYGDITTGVVQVANGGTGVTTSSGANSVVLRDANGNITTNCLFEGFTSQAASGTTITLTASSVQNWVITGSGGQTIKLPNATTLPNGAIFTFNNNQSSGAITVVNNSSTTIATINSGGFVTVNLQDNSTAAGSWDRHDSTPANVSWSTNTLDYAGSITSATWNGNTVAYNRGGTGQSSAFVAGGVVYGASTSALAVTPIGTSGQVLTSAGAGTPVWSTPTTGTVTSITAGTGLTGGTITSSGTIAIDSTVATLTGSQTLTNKTISGASNTLTNIGNTSLTNSAITINGTSTSLGGSISVGTVTGVTATSPVVSSGGTAPVISMPAATGSVNGYLTSTDWTTFNNKGSGTVTSVTATSPVTSTGGTTPVIAMPAATGSVNGYLTSTDWTTFNNKGSGTVTSASVVSANGFAGTVATATTTPAITISTSITGVLKGNGTAISAATAGTDYSAGTSALGTGILKSTTTTGALTIAVAADFPTLNQNTTGSAATLTTPRGIYGNNFDGSAALTQIIASTYGGTGNGFTKFSGATTAEKTYTLPDSNATLLYAGGPLGTPSSGTLTNATGLPVGGISATGTPSASTYLRGDGAWSTVTASSATNLAGGALGSVPYQLLSGTTVFLAGNTTTTPQFLTSTGALGLATAPTYTGSTGSGNVVLATSPTLVTPVLGTPTSATLTNATGLPLSTGVTGTLPAANGGTAQSTYATGDILYASAANTLSKLTVGSTGQVLTVASGAPSWAAAASSNITSLGLYENSATIGANYTIGTGNNAMSAGPITISTGFTVTVPTGSTWTVV